MQSMLEANRTSPAINRIVSLFSSTSFLFAAIDFVDDINPPRFNDLRVFAGIALAKKLSFQLGGRRVTAGRTRTFSAAGRRRNQ